MKIKEAKPSSTRRLNVYAKDEDFPNVNALLDHIAILLANENDPTGLRQLLTETDDVGLSIVTNVNGQRAIFTMGIGLY